MCASAVDSILHSDFQPQIETLIFYGFKTEMNATGIISELADENPTGALNPLPEFKRNPLGKN